MVAQILKGFTQEQIVQMSPARASKLPFSLKSVVRMVDKKGNTLALVLDRETLDNIQEEMEAQTSPKFWAELEKSRKSGRVSGKDIEKRLGIK